MHSQELPAREEVMSDVLPCTPLYAATFRITLSDGLLIAHGTGLGPRSSRRWRGINNSGGR